MACVDTSSPLPLCSWLAKAAKLVEIAPSMDLTAPVYLTHSAVCSQIQMFQNGSKWPMNASWQHWLLLVRK